MFISKARIISWFSLSLFVGLGLPSWADHSADHSADHAVDIKDACRQLVIDYAYYRDRPDADAVAGLFTTDAVFEIQGNAIRGREAIRQRVAAGEGGPSFRHLMSTIKIIPDDSSRAHGVSYVTVYSAAGKLPQAVDGYLAIGEYHDEFVLTQAGWRIQRRAFVPVFLPPSG